MENFNVSVILPIESSKHKDFDELFSKSIQSILNQSVPLTNLY